MKHNDEHQDEGQKSVFWVLSVVSGQSYGSFLFKYLRLRRPSLAPNVWYVIRKYAKIPW